MSRTDVLAVVVVTWNVRQLALACLEAVYADAAQDRLDVRVWLVDNASDDGTVEAVQTRFPQTEVIANETNLGFASGNNAALRAMGFREGDAHSGPDAVLLLNPDTAVRPGALKALLEFMQGTPGAGIAGARLIYGDGSFQHGAFGFPGLWQLAIDLFPFPGRIKESKLNGRYPRGLYNGDRPFPIDHPLGAAMLVRREAIQRVGLMDEDYHLYCEEIDWALRIKAAGWQAYCVPSAEVVHYGGQSTSQIRPQAVVNLWTSRLRLYARYYSPLKRWLALLVMRAGLNRQIKLVARDSSLDETTQAALVDAYATVLKKAYWREYAVHKSGRSGD